ncbi:hypothetical protein ACJW30_08G057200 [Castanea mollissima]
MSLVPSFFGSRRTNILDPFSLEIWDPFKDFPFPSESYGLRKVKKEEKKETWHRVERSSGKFLRSFKLPENAKMDQVKAAVENGVLTVTVPKVEMKKPDVKSIEISG